MDDDPVVVLRRKLVSIGQIGEDDLRALSALPWRVEMQRRGAEVVADGIVSKRCCLLIRGYMHRQKILENGARQILAFHFAGDIPDLQSLHVELMDHALIATSDCKVAFIEHEPLRALSHRHPVAGDRLWRTSLIDAAIFRAWIMAMGRKPAPEQLAHLICECFVRMAAVGLTEKNSCFLPITQEQLADALGLSAVHTNRSLQELREQELVEWSSGMVVIRDWSRMRLRAGFDPAYLHLQTRLDFDPHRPVQPIS